MADLLSMDAKLFDGLWDAYVRRRELERQKDRHALQINSVMSNSNMDLKENAEARRERMEAIDTELRTVEEALYPPIGSRVEEAEDLLESDALFAPLRKKRMLDRMREEAEQQIALERAAAEHSGD